VGKEYACLNHFSVLILS